MIKIIWEPLEQDQSGYLSRTKVPGGWLVKEVMDVLTDTPHEGPYTTGYEWRSALCFVPDPTYSWE